MIKSLSSKPKMLQEDKKINPNSPREQAKDGVRELILYIFMAISGAISGAITFLMAVNMWSLWPFVGWFVVVIAFAFLLEHFYR